MANALKLYNETALGFENNLEQSSDGWWRGGGSRGLSCHFQEG